MPGWSRGDQSTHRPGRGRTKSTQRTSPEQVYHGADGGCKLPALDKERLDRQHRSLWSPARLQIDLSAFKDCAFPTRHDISGLPYKDKQEYRAVIYSIGVYRPGIGSTAAVLRTQSTKHRLLTCLLNFNCVMLETDCAKDRCAHQ